LQQALEQRVTQETKQGSGAVGSDSHTDCPSRFATRVCFRVRIWRPLTCGRPLQTTLAVLNLAAWRRLWGRKWLCTVPHFRYDRNSFWRR